MLIFMAHLLASDKLSLLGLPGSSTFASKTKSHSDKREHAPKQENKGILNGYRPEYIPVYT